MKRITLITFFLLANISLGQIQLNEDFDQSNLPTGWTTNGLFSSTNIATCQGNSLRVNLNNQHQADTIYSPLIGGLSNGKVVNIQFDYKVLDNAGTSIPNVATSNGWGNFIFSYSIDQGSTWNDFYTIDNNNYNQSNTCTTVLTTNSNMIPIGADFQLRIKAEWLQGDYFIYIDNLNINQIVNGAPNCDATLITPSNGSNGVDINPVIQWQHATGGPIAYKLSIGTTSGGTDIANNVVVSGGATTYSPPTLNELTTYYLTIIPFNLLGDATGCTEYTFTTEEVCEVPTNVAFNGVTPYEVNVSWIEVGSSTEWEILYGEENFDISTQGTLIVDNDATPDQLIDNLSPNTTYDVYVRSICSLSNSDWTVKESFTTLVLPVNDECINAIQVQSLPYNNSQDATWATNNDGFISACGGLGMNDGVWYTFSGDNDEIYITIEETSNWDSEIALYSGDCSNLVCVNSVDLAEDVQVLSFSSQLNKTYYLNIGYYSGTMDNPEGAFKIEISNNLSTNKEVFNSFNYYPNPVSSTLNLEADKIINQIEIFSVTGRRVMLIQPNSLIKEVNLESMANGIYLMKITIENQTKTFKILKE